MTKTSKVIDIIVNNDLCIGCGMCVYKCSSKALKMSWNEQGFLIPELLSQCSSDAKCLSVCPFNPFPNDNVKTENELATLFINSARLSNNVIGKYTAIYAGYSTEFRAKSSSGGIATYILNELLERGIIDHIIAVSDSKNTYSQFEYTIISSRSELLCSSGTKYYPTTLSNVLSELDKIDGKFAIVGVACFVKAIRLAQYYDSTLLTKIPFLVGIICGGAKSKFFTEYLAAKVGVAKENILKPRYRVKNTQSTANDYSFACIDTHTQEVKSIKMRSVGEMWGTGLFKANACDFCDDVTTELSDISLGDAWIQPFCNDGQGTNIIVTRSDLADSMIKDGYKIGKLWVENLPLERFLESQQGSFNHRHTGLSVRIKHAKEKNFVAPPKRFSEGIVALDYVIVQRLRSKIRKRSLEIWKDSCNVQDFDKTIKKYLRLLRVATQVYHYRRAILKRVKTFLR